MLHNLEEHEEGGEGGRGAHIRTALSLTLLGAFGGVDQVNPGPSKPAYVLGIYIQVIYSVLMMAGVVLKLSLIYRASIHSRQLNPL